MIIAQPTKTPIETPIFPFAEMDAASIPNDLESHFRIDHPAFVK